MTTVRRPTRATLVRARSVSFVGLGLALYAGLFPGCGSSAEERIRASALGAGCTLDSECDPNFCIFERCHEECDTDFDCPDEQRCVKGSSDVNVCQLPDERDCDADSDCEGAQGCAEDGQCRDICRSIGDCVPGQLCTKTGVCVSPERDELDDDGELIAGGSGTGGSGGTSGEGGRGGTDAGGEAGNEAGGGTSSGTGGKGGAGGTASAGEGGEAGTSGATGNGGGAGVGGSLGGMAGNAGMAGSAGMAGAAGAAGAAGSSGTGGSAPVDENEPNDTRDTPGDLPIDRDLHGSIDPPTDFDFYEFGPPSGAPVNGYFTWTLTDVGPSSPSVYLYSTVDDGLIYGDETRGVGVSLFGFFGAVAGARYQIRVGRWAGGAGVPLPYTLRANYHPVSDIYEPNDTILEASDIELASTVNAYVVTGYESSSVSVADFEDWYGFTTDAGQIEVHVTQVPLDVDIWVRVYDPNGAGVGAAVAGADAGASLAPFMRTLTSSGRYYFRVTYTSAQPQSGAFTDTPGEVPNHFTRPYTFTIRKL